MHIIFINYNRFIDSSGIHIHFLGNELGRRGIGCTVCIPRVQERPEIFGTTHYNLVQFNRMRNITWLERLRLKLKNPILHAWTPRENVRMLTYLLARSLFCRYYVHIEDNEERILESQFKLPFSAIRELPLPVLDERLRGDIIHPLYYQPFLKGAAGVTCIMDTLEQFVPDGVPSMTFWPACEPEFYDIPETPDPDLRDRLGLEACTTVVTYTGNMHRSNVEEITCLYEAVGIVNEAGYPLILLRTGTDSTDYCRDVSAIRERYVRDYGSCSAGEIRQYIAVADILVQPGKADSFNNYRFPSKLPMALASGRPVILPPTNIGRFLQNGVNCLHLKDGSAVELATRIRTLIEDSELRHRIGTGGREFAMAHLSWEKSAGALVEFYRRTGHSLFRRMRG